MCILLGQKCETLELAIVVSERMELTNEGNAKVSSDRTHAPPRDETSRARRYSCQVALNGFYYASEVAVEDVGAGASRSEATKTSKCESATVDCVDSSDS